MTRLLLLLASAVLAACVPGGRRAPACTGPVTVTVRNNWSYSVDVYARMHETGGFILGEVFPGERRHFDLPEGAAGVYYEVRARTVVRRPTASDIATSYTCR